MRRFSLQLDLSTNVLFDKSLLCALIPMDKSGKSRLIYLIWFARTPSI